MKDNITERKEWYKRLVLSASNAGYIVACSALYFISLAIIGFSCVIVYKEMMKPSFSTYAILDEVGLIVFSIAVFDVAKHLLLEEVFKGKKAQDSNELKTTLVKFMNIIITAILLKGLVLAIETSTKDITQIFYPILLIISPSFLLISLGVYLKLSSKN